MFTLEQMQKDFHELTKKRDAAFNTFQQCLGALGILQNMINHALKLTKDDQAINNEEPKENQENEQTNNEPAQ